MQVKVLKRAQVELPDSVAEQKQLAGRYVYQVADAWVCNILSTVRAYRLIFTFIIPVIDFFVFYSQLFSSSFGVYASYNMIYLTLEITLFFQYV